MLMIKTVEICGIFFISEFCVEMGEVKREVGQFFVCIKGTQCTFEGSLDEESRTLA